MQTLTSSQSKLFSVNQRACLSTIIAAVGMLVGTWASRIPALQEELKISHAMLSMVLLCGALGGLLSCPLATRILQFQGGRKTVFHGSIGVCIALVSIGLASNIVLLMAAVLTLGLATGCYTLGINAVASQYESVSGKSEMAKLYAWGCVGSLVGTVSGSIAASIHIKPLLHFMLVVAPLAAVLWTCFWTLELDSVAEPANGGRTFALPSGRLTSLGILAFCITLAGNGIADWSGIFLKEEFEVAAGLAPMALAVFSAMVLLGRLQGDRLKAAHGASRLVSVGASFSTAGLLLAVFAPTAYVALAGFACAGIGMSLVYPFIFSAVGKEGTLALCAVATMSNLGGLTGPLVLGSLANYLGLQFAIGFIGLLCLIIAIVASRTILLR